MQVVMSSLLKTTLPLRRRICTQQSQSKQTAVLLGAAHRSTVRQHFSAVSGLISVGASEEVGAASQQACEAGPSGLQCYQPTLTREFVNRPRTNEWSSVEEVDKDNSELLDIGAASQQLSMDDIAALRAAGKTGMPQRLT